MRNFDQSNTLPEFDLELFIHCELKLAGDQLDDES